MKAAYELSTPEDFARQIESRLRPTAWHWWPVWFALPVFLLLDFESLRRAIDVENWSLVFALLFTPLMLVVSWGALFGKWRSNRARYQTIERWMAEQGYLKIIETYGGEGLTPAEKRIYREIHTQGGLTG